MAIPRPFIPRPPASLAAQTTSEGVAIVYKTNRYDDFRALQGNREVTELRVERIMKSINAVGCRLCPIVVNKDMMIIDGQGRLEALKRLGLPVYYVVDATAGLEECRWLNIGMTNWSIPDFVRSYSESGSTAYQILSELLDEYGAKLPIVVIAAATQKGYALPSTDTIRRGNFKVYVSNDEARADLDILAPLFDSRTKEGIGGIRSFLYAALFVLRCGQLDRGRVISVLRKIANDKTVVYPAGVPGNIALIDMAYNFKLCARNRVDIVHKFKAERMSKDINKE